MDMYQNVRQNPFRGKYPLSKQGFKAIPILNVPLAKSADRCRGQIVSYIVL